MPAEAVDFKRIDTCQEIRAEQRDNAVIFYSKRWWVAIVLPPNGAGYQKFTYRWGSVMFWLDGRQITEGVAFGPMVRG